MRGLHYPSHITSYTALAPATFLLLLFSKQNSKYISKLQNETQQFSSHTKLELLILPGQRRPQSIVGPVVWWCGGGSGATLSL